MRRIGPLPRRAAAALVVAALLAGCAHTFDATALGVRATLASPAGQQPGGTPFRVTSRALFLLWGLVPVSSPSLEKALAGQLVGGREVTDVRIRVRSRWSDVLITGLTLGLVVPRAITVEGVVRGEPGDTAAAR
ncbi:MAG TPA: hypothetical protein VNK43_13565 [Gemmatimonadales bacterium]|nr:hypothetical protein [Gemmatimonadales bacterium]